MPNGNEVQTAGVDPTTTVLGPGATIAQAPDGFFTPDSNLNLEKESSPIVDTNNNGIVDEGDTITYTFTVTNNGNVLVNGITIDDNMIPVVGLPLLDQDLATRRN